MIGIWDSIYMSPSPFEKKQKSKQFSAHLPLLWNLDVIVVPACSFLSRVNLLFRVGASDAWVNWSSLLSPPRSSFVAVEGSQDFPVLFVFLLKGFSWKSCKAMSWFLFHIRWNINACYIIKDWLSEEGLSSACFRELNTSRVSLYVSVLTDVRHFDEKVSYRTMFDLHSESLKTYIVFIS